MAGYYGYSKSNNAVSAEIDGKFPLSKRTKALFVDTLIDMLGRDSDVYRALAGKPMGFIKAKILRSYEYHHTSSWYNTTDYYEFDPVRWDDVNEIETLYAEYVAETAREKTRKIAEKQPPKRYRCKFLVWSGSRKHPKASECEEIGEIRGNWFYCSVGKKSVCANGFEILEEIV